MSNQLQPRLNLSKTKVATQSEPNDNLFYMPLYIDRLMGGTMKMKTRTKSAYLWCIITLWQGCIIKSNEIDDVLEDVWGGEIPQKEREQILSKLDMDDEGNYFSKRLEEIRVESIERISKGRSKSLLGVETKFFKGAGFTQQEARALAEYTKKMSVRSYPEARIQKRCVL